MKRILALVMSLMPLVAFAQPYTPIQYIRPYDQRGVNVFEAPKQDSVAFTGANFKLGVGFAQQFQALQHENQADVVTIGTGNTAYNQNELIGISPGFNLASANLNLDAQLADGIRLNVIAYLSSRHHSETWVKGGYIQIDKLPMLKSEALDNLMKYVTLKVGHFEVNYGDGHFRRTDNGNAMYNAFIGNPMLDAFTTEIGGEVYVQNSGLLGMVGVTGGEIKGDVNNVGKRAPAFYGKVGFDKQLSEDLRVRLTGSANHRTKAVSNTLYAGDRAGSRFYSIMENVKSSLSSNFRSGLWNPEFSSSNTSFMINPFVKFKGLELFGTIEQASGRKATETEDRQVTQLLGEAIFRFLPREQAYVGAQYNTVSGDMLFGTAAQKVTQNRIQIGAGWFVTPQILAKVAYINQSYVDFPSNDLRSEGQFNGFMIEGVVAF